jgi:hypothetical protein
VRYVPAGSLRTASAEQIFPRDSVQRNCFELALYTARDYDCISNRIGSGIRSAMQMSSRYVRCVPNAVDDRTDHHADRSSTSRPSSSPHRQVRRCHRSIHCWHGHAARRSALPRERFSPLARNGPPAMSAVRSLSGVNRTWHGKPILVEIDPTETWGPDHRLKPNVNRFSLTARLQSAIVNPSARRGPTALGTARWRISVPAINELRPFVAAAV